MTDNFIEVGQAYTMPGCGGAWTNSVFTASEVKHGTRLYAKGGDSPNPRLDKAEFLIDSHMNLAINAIQWLKNIQDGISTVEEALANMAKCKELADEDWERFRQGDYSYGRRS